MAWDGEERRENNVIIGVMREMREWLEKHEEAEHAKYEAIRREIMTNRTEFEKRHEDMMKRFESMSSSTMSVVQQQNTALNEIHKLFKTAFPEGDAESHRRAHETWMEKDKQEQQFWTDIKKQVVGWGVTALLAWGGIVIWAAFVKGPGA